MPKGVSLVFFSAQTQQNQSVFGEKMILANANCERSTLPNAAIRDDGVMQL